MMLGVNHFKPKSQNPVASMPVAKKIATQLGSACNRALGRLCQAPWVVTLDYIEDEASLVAEVVLTTLRLESELGLMTIYVGIDKQAISALIEATLGGMGSESAFAMPDRSPSRIEKGVVQLILAGLAQELAQVLGQELGRPFNSLEIGHNANQPEHKPQLVSFHYSINLFDYSGELSLSVAREELLLQIGSLVASASFAANTAKAQLQREIGRSELTLTVSLGPETLSIEELSALAPGKMLELSSTASMPVTVWSSGVAAYQGTLARTGDRLAVCLTTAL